MLPFPDARAASPVRAANGRRWLDDWRLVRCQRHVLERERTCRALATYQRELEATVPGHTPTRERLAWQIRLVQKRMAEIDALLRAARSWVTLK